MESGLEFLSGLTRLESLRLPNCRIQDISPLAELADLKVLDLSNNRIFDLSPLENLTNLAVLGLESNPVRDISPLVRNQGLGAGDYIDLRYSELDLSDGSDTLQQVALLQARGADLDIGNHRRFRERWDPLYGSTKGE